jgi:hypothetical protein
MKLAPSAALGLSLLVACSSAPSDRDAQGSAALAANEKESCVCALDQICDVGSGACIARPTPAAGESFTQVELLGQYIPTQTDILSKLGKASASFNAADPMPKDTRRKFTTDEGEDCFFEVGTNYPASYEGGYWPSTPGLDAGTLTFKVTSGKSAIELDPSTYKSDTGYFHNESLPPALEDGAAEYPDFFDPSYLPPGAPVTMQIGGSADVAAATVPGELPSAFTITEPAVESGTVSAVSGADLPVSWSPAQPSAYMEIFITMFQGDMLLLSCKVKDDGHVVIPGAGLNPFYGDVGIQLRRTTERYSQIRQADGKVVHAFVSGRHARIGNLSMTLR